MALILIVTDEPDKLLELRRDLESAGHRSVLAADADTALARLAGLPIEVVVLDIMMPVQDGWMVLEALRDQRQPPPRDRRQTPPRDQRQPPPRDRRQPPPPPPVIVVSGRAGPLDLARARRLGAFELLSAHVSAEQLIHAVAQALVSN